MILASLAFFLLPSKVHCSAVLVHDWRTFRSTCPVNFRWCLVKCADPKKKFRTPTPVCMRNFVCRGGGAGGGSEAWFRYLIRLCIFLRGGGQTPLPHLDPRMGSDGTQVLLIHVIYPQQVSNPSYFIITWSLNRNIFNRMCFVSILFACRKFEYKYFTQQTLNLSYFEQIFF